MEYVRIPAEQFENLPGYYFARVILANGDLPLFTEETNSYFMKRISFFDKVKTYYSLVYQVLAQPITRKVQGFPAVYAFNKSQSHLNFFLVKI